MRENKDNLKNKEIELALIGAILLNQDIFPEVFIKISNPNFFYFKQHQFIYAACISLYQSNQIIDAVSLCNELKKKKTLEAVGGAAYISEIIDKTTSYSNFNYTCDELKNLYSRRILDLKLFDKIEKIPDLDIPLDQTIREIQDAIIAVTLIDKKGSRPFEEILKTILNRSEEIYKNKEKIVGILSGYSMLDEILCGFAKSDLIILAARPSMGKTALMLNIALKIAKRRIPVGIISLEQTDEQLVTRMISIESGIEASKFRNGNFYVTDNGPSDFKIMCDTSEMLTTLPIHLEYMRGSGPNKIILQMKIMKQRYGIKMFFIDHLEEFDIQGYPAHMRTDERINDICKKIKDTASELETPVMMLDQLSRKPEDRFEKGKSPRPLTADLKNSGGIEIIADAIMLLYREVRYKPDTEIPELAELIITKQREGAIGKLGLWFEEKCLKFEDYKS